MFGTGLKEFATPVVRNLIIINVIIFIAGNFIPGLNGQLQDLFALHSLYGEDFRPWQFVTYMFLHADFHRGGIMHLFGNMFALYMFGAWLERVWGGKRFLFFYFFTGIGGGLLYWAIISFQFSNFAADIAAFNLQPTSELALQIIRDHAPMVLNDLMQNLDFFQSHPNDPEIIAQFKYDFKGIFSILANVPTLGASGAVFGILLAFAMLFPNTELMLLFPPIPIKAKYFVLLYGAFEVYMQFKNAPDDNVAHLAHLSGMLFAFILVKYWNNQRNSFY